MNQQAKQFPIEQALPNEHTLTKLWPQIATTLTIAKATRSRVEAFGLSFSHEGKNGHWAPVSWAA